MTILRTVSFEREIVVEAPDEELAKAIAKRMAPDLVFKTKYPTEHDPLTVRKVPETHPTTEETLRPPAYPPPNPDDPDITLH